MSESGLHDKWVLPTNTWATAGLSIEVKKSLIMHATSILVTRESKTYQACLRVGTVGDFDPIQTEQDREAFKTLLPAGIEPLAELRTNINNELPLDMFNHI